MRYRDIILFDATLFVDAYEAQLFRTGLYRVSEQLFLQLLEQYPLEQIYLYDTQGRNRLMRQVVLPSYTGVKLLDTDSRLFAWFSDAALRKADYCREKEHSVVQTWRVNGWKLLKNLLREYGTICRRLMPPQQIVLPTSATHLQYIATYYPIPQWVHQRGIRATLIVHDLIPLIHPEWFPTEANKKLLNEIIHSVNKEDSVVCVSHATRLDFLHFRSDFPDTRVQVAHLASFIQKRNFSRACLPSYANQPYLLSVCTLEPRKNLITVLRAYEHLLLQDCGAAPNLILVGAMGWKTGELVATICRLQTEYPNKIHLTGYIPDEQLLLLYEHALLFLYLSLYEGFGLPPLEAMSCGCPVVTSNVSSLPEVIGCAGWTVEPTDVQAIVKVIEQVLDTDGAILRSRSLNRAQQFSWKQFANKIIETLA